MPNVVFIVIEIFYLHESLKLSQLGSEERDSDALDTTVLVMGILAIILAVYASRTEILQFKGEPRKLLYFCSILNWADLFGLIGTLFLNIVTIGEFDIMPMENLRIIGALTAFLLILKLYDWCRLFNVTAFYVLLVQATLRDALVFLMLLLLALLMFGVPISILNFNREGDDAQLIADSYGFWLVDCIYNQYLLALGEFATLDAYAGDA